MKTPEEIVDWLKGHKWYRSYVKNVTSNYSKDYEKGIRDSYLNGENGTDTIIAAFRWSEYPYRRRSGIKFWGFVHDEFIKWYNT